MSQADKIYADLHLGRLVTSMTAFKSHKITRLADIIYKLRRQGFAIETIMLPTADGKSKYALYRIVR